MDAESPEMVALLGEAGLALWRDMTGVYTFGPGELRILLAACTEWDRVIEYDADVAEHGAMIEDKQGRRVNPAATAARLGRREVDKLIASLRLPDLEDGSRPQRRSGVRGPQQRRGYYSINGRGA